MRRVKRLFLIGNETQYGREWLVGVHHYCRSHGRWEYHLEGDISPESVKPAQSIMHKWNPNGIIADVRNSHIERFVRDSGLPVVNVNGISHINLPTVISDYKTMGRRGARHFLDNGFRHFGFFADTPTMDNHTKRIGFVEELASAGFDCSVFESQPGDRTGFSWIKLHRKMDAWLRSLKKPVAILCIHVLRQEIAGGCLRLGFRVPEEVAIVGMGTQEILCEMSMPPLSSVVPDVQRIGYEAARLLDRLIHRAAPPSQPILVPPRQVEIRQSSDIIALDDPIISAALRFIRRNADRSFNVAEMMEDIPISRRLLEQRFKKYLGRTPRAEIMRVRLERAKNMLVGTDLPMLVVAQNTGFVTHDMLSVSFRRELGLTPTQYRRNYRIGAAASKAPGAG